MNRNKSTVEDAAMEWFGALGYAIGHGPQLASLDHASLTKARALRHPTSSMAALSDRC